MANRTIVVGGVWANGAADVPLTPTPLTTYKNSTLTSATIQAAWPFSKIVDSAILNEMMFRLTTLMSQLEVSGILNWCNTTPYMAGGLAFGSDNVIYKAVQANTGVDPTIDSGTNWIKLSEFSSGTKLVFSQASAPTGWTKSITVDDTTIRIVSGTTGGTTGGTHGLSSPPSTSHLHTTNSHTLSIAEMPYHSHNFTSYSGTVALQGGESLWSSAMVNPIFQNATTAYTGSGGSHNHGDTTLGGSTAFAPKYLDSILCTKA